MADLDGFAATRRLAADEATAQHSGHRGHGERARRHAPGGAGRRLRRLRAEAGARRGGVRRAADAPRRRRSSSGAEPRSPATCGSADPVRGRDARRAACARRSAIGAVERSRGHCRRADAAATTTEAALGQRLARLAASFDFDGVRELAASLSTSAGAAMAADAVAATAAVPPSTILVVDDSATNLQVLVRTLHGSGHRILVARDGPTALDIAQRAHARSGAARRDDAGHRRLRGLPRAQGAARDAQHRRHLPVGARRSRPTRCRASSSAPSTTSPSRFRREEVLARVATHLSRQHLERALRRQPRPPRSASWPAPRACSG